MANEPSHESNTVTDGLSRLREIAPLLREMHHLNPKAQQLLADLVGELTKTLDEKTLPAQEAAHLAECAAQLVQSVQQQKETHVIAETRDRLEKAIVGVETRAPMLTGLFERLVDALASVGI